MKIFLSAFFGFVRLKNITHLEISVKRDLLFTSEI